MSEKSSLISERFSVSHAVRPHNVLISTISPILEFANCNLFLRVHQSELCPHTAGLGQSIFLQLCVVLIHRAMQSATWYEAFKASAVIFSSWSVGLGETAAKSEIPAVYLAISLQVSLELWWLHAFVWVLLHKKNTFSAVPLLPLRLNPHFRQDSVFVPVSVSVVLLFLCLHLPSDWGVGVAHPESAFGLRRGERNNFNHHDLQA